MLLTEFLLYCIFVAIQNLNSCLPDVFNQCAFLPWFAQFKIDVLQYPVWKYANILAKDSTWLKLKGLKITFRSMLVDVLTDLFLCLVANIQGKWTTYCTPMDQPWSASQPYQAEVYQPNTCSLEAVENRGTHDHHWTLLSSHKTLYTTFFEKIGWLSPRNLSYSTFFSCLKPPNLP